MYSGFNRGYMWRMGILRIAIRRSTARMELNAALRGMDKGHGRRRPDSNGKQKRTVVLQHAVIQLIEKTGALPGLKKQGAA